MRSLVVMWRCLVMAETLVSETTTVARKSMVERKSGWRPGNPDRWRRSWVVRKETMCSDRNCLRRL